MRKTIAVTIGLAAILLAVSYLAQGRQGWAIAIALIALLWLAEPWHGVRWVDTLGLYVFSVSAGAGAWFGLRTLWLLSSLVLALVAWDLSRFRRYLCAVTDVRGEAALVNSHYRRLAIVAGLGWLLGVAALSLRLSYSFIVALALTSLAVLGLTGAIRYVRRESD